MPDETLLRPATATDWSESAAERQGVTPIDVGAEAYARDDDECSYRNCVVAERDGAVLGVLLTFPMQRRETPAAPPPYDGSDLYAPYKYLEAPDTWYVCGVALYPEHRGQGIGGRFMALAESQARERGFDRVSLVAFEENAGGWGTRRWREHRWYRTH
jgi:GNAT superfamily N-acetyltransferase